MVATVVLKEKQDQMNIDAKKPINSCANRWNSTNEMLEHVLAVLSDKMKQCKLVEGPVPVLEQFRVAIF